MKFGTAEGQVGPLAHAKFHANLCTGMGMQPQNGKNFHFLVKSRPAGANPLTDFFNS